MKPAQGWIDIESDGHKVIGMADFMKKYEKQIPEWVKDFVAKGTKNYNYGHAVVIDCDDIWERDFEGTKIVQLGMVDPDGVPTILIGEYDKFVTAKVMRQCPTDGQHRTSIK